MNAYSLNLDQKFSSVNEMTYSNLNLNIEADSIMEESLYSQHHYNVSDTFYKIWVSSFSKPMVEQYLVNEIEKDLEEFQLINTLALSKTEGNGRLYDPYIVRMLSPDNGVYIELRRNVVDATNSQDYNRYTYARNNPLKYVDPDGEFIVWSIHRGGFSIRVNFTPIGIGGGGGLNFGWGNGFSAGVYGEVGYRVGGTGFGAGATVTQSLDYNFKHNVTTTTTSAGAFASFGPFNAGGNVASTYDLTNMQHIDYSWGVSAGVGIGNEKGGVGLFVGYGSGGWNYGLGGYYDPKIDLKNYGVVITAEKDGSYSDYLSQEDFLDGRSFNNGDFQTNLRDNPNVREVSNVDGSYTYTLKVPKRHTINGIQSDGSTNIITSTFSSRPGRVSFTTLDRANSATFFSLRPYSNNYFNFKNFNTYNNRGQQEGSKHLNLFGYTWFR